MAQTWPASVPHKPAVDSLRGIGFQPPLSTDMDGGNRRRRRNVSLNTASLDMTIHMTNAQFLIFKAWVRDTLVDGTLPFTMPIWTGAAYEERTCSFVEPYQFGAAGSRRQSVSFQLDVEGY